MAINQDELRRAGAPTRLDMELGNEIAGYVQRGASIRSAAMLAGVAESTINQWLSRGRGNHERPQTPLYTWFAVQVEKAWAKQEQKAVDVVRGIAEYAERDSDKLAAAKFLLTHGPTREHWKPAKSEVEQQHVGEIVISMPTPLEIFGEGAEGDIEDAELVVDYGEWDSTDSPDDAYPALEAGE